MNYNPYDYSNVTELLMYLYSLGWYSHTLDLLTITMQGGFEAFSGRASDTWEHSFLVQTCAVPEHNIPSFESRGHTVGDACGKILTIIKQSKERT